MRGEDQLSAFHLFWGLNIQDLTYQNSSSIVLQGISILKWSHLVKKRSKRVRNRTWGAVASTSHRSGIRTSWVWSISRDFSYPFDPISLLHLIGSCWKLTCHIPVHLFILFFLSYQAYEGVGFNVIILISVSYQEDSSSILTGRVSHLTRRNLMGYPKPTRAPCIMGRTSRRGLSLVNIAHLGRNGCGFQKFSSKIHTLYGTL